VIPHFPVYLFDVDGTLVDSAVDVCGAIRAVLSATTKPDVDDAFLRRYIGFHLNDLFEDLFPEKSPAEIEDLVAEYRRVYPLRNHASTTRYPGVKEALSALGGRKSTATTKGTTNTRIVLEKCGLLPYFDHVQGTDGFPHKPEPDVLLASIKVFGARPEDCLMVGDAAPDMDAGRRAGVKICGIRYGYGNIAEMEKFKPDFWISDLRELVHPQWKDASASHD
jgi:phosphoglycolate phosphatase